MINLKKYGFVRCPNEDFNDDGSRFSVYRRGRIYLTKCISFGTAYISARIDGYLMNDEDSKLDGYNELDALCGTKDAKEITDEDLQKLSDVCETYEKAYNEAESKLFYPTEDEIKAEIEASEFSEAYKKVKESDLTKLESYEASTVANYLKELLLQDLKSTHTYVKKYNYMHNSGCARDRIPNGADLEHSYYYTEIMNILNRIK